jgi:hypothetical protein
MTGQVDYVKQPDICGNENSIPSETGEDLTKPTRV